MGVAGVRVGACQRAGSFAPTVLPCETADLRVRPPARRIPILPRGGVRRNSSRFASGCSAGGRERTRVGTFWWSSSRGEASFAFLRVLGFAPVRRQRSPGGFIRNPRHDTSSLEYKLPRLVCVLWRIRRTARCLLTQLNARPLLRSSPPSPVCVHQKDGTIRNSSLVTHHLSLTETEVRGGT